MTEHPAIREAMNYLALKTHQELDPLDIRDLKAAYQILTLVDHRQIVQNIELMHWLETVISFAMGEPYEFPPPPWVDHDNEPKPKKRWRLSQS